MNTPNSLQTLQARGHYRRDIDGLRAIAVLLVVGFHAFPDIVTGGFIGVDIFFVISGFLISNIIYSAQSYGNFKYSAFYARRIRRIIPSLVVVLAFVWVCGKFILLPIEQPILGIQISAGAVFLVNFALWHTFGYFSPSIDALPLMHLWSLGIEEQFYIIWPILLVLSARFSRFRIRFLFLMFMLSFIANIFLVYSSATAAFYSPLSRIWEMAAGGLLATIKISTLASSRRYIAITLSAVGAMLLLLAVWLINKDCYFPGWWGLLPVAGTVLLIAGGDDTWFNRYILGSKLLVAVGLVSYPFYLWHWPLLSFARIMEEATPSVFIRVVVVVCGFLLACLTYWFVEKPIRSAPQKTSIIAGLCALMACLFLAGVMMATQIVDPSLQYPAREPYERHWQGWSMCNHSQNCRIIDPSKPVDIVVVGDSHAGHLADGLLDMARSTGENILVLQRSNCLPVYSIKMDDDVFFNCEGFSDYALNEALGTISAKKIILAGYANNFLYHYPEGVPENPNLRDLSSNFSDKVNAVHLKAFSMALDLTLKKVLDSDKKIIFIVDNPEISFDPYECVSMRSFVLPGHKLRSPCSISKSVYSDRSSSYLDVVSSAKTRNPSVKFIYTDKALCDENQCMAMEDGGAFI